MATMTSKLEQGPVQQSYANGISALYQGMIYDQREVATVLTRTVVVNPIAFGVPVFQGPPANSTIDNVVTAVGDRTIQPFVAGGSYVGFSVLSTTQLPDAGDMYPLGSDAAVIVKGPVVGYVSGAVGANNPVYYDTSGNLSSTTTGTLIPGAVFESSTTSAGGLVKIRLG